MPNPLPSLTVVVPVFNSAATIQELHARIITTLQRVEGTADVIYVDDGSRDGVWNHLQTLAASCPIARAIRLSRNFGQTGAVICGLAHASGALVVTIDDDLQNAPEDILKLYQRMCADPNIDVIFATPSNRKQHGPIRTAASRLLATIDRISSGSQYRGFTSSFRIMRRSVVEAILGLRLPNPAIAPMIFAVSRFIECEPVVHYPRKVGQSGYTGFRLARLAVTRVLMSTSLPLKLLAYTGIAGLLFCLLAGCVTLVGYTFGQIKQPGWTTLVLLHFTSTSLSFIGFGILGEYLHRVLGSLQHLPQYVVHDMVTGAPHGTTSSLVTDKVYGARAAG